MDKEKFVTLLTTRFNENMKRHPHITFETIRSYLKINPSLLETIFQMEKTGGEPDVVLLEDSLYFVDFSKETPEGRRNLCYDEKARLSRKKFPPETSAEKLAREMGIKILDETMYKLLQDIEPFDLKTSSWLDTPLELRALGGALFGDRRYNRTFIYHNGADSYYGVRGFRGYIKIK